MRVQRQHNSASLLLASWPSTCTPERQLGLANCVYSIAQNTVTVSKKSCLLHSVWLCSQTSISRCRILLRLCLLEFVPSHHSLFTKISKYLICLYTVSLYSQLLQFLKGSLISLFSIKIQVLPIRKLLFSKQKPTKITFDKSKWQALHKHIELFESQNAYKANTNSNRNT